MTPHNIQDSGYRWIIVFASGAMLAITMGVMVNGISVFLIPLNEEFGWQRGAISLINFSGLIGLALGGIIMGKLADKTSTKRVVLMGAIVFGLCLIASSYANTLWQFYILFFVAGFLGAGAVFTPLIANVGKWFKAAPGLALGIASAWQALGQGGIPFGAANLIGSIGWRNALVTLGVVALVTLIPLSLLIRHPPDERGKVAASKSDLLAEEAQLPLPTNIVVAWLGIAVLFCCICMSVPLMHLVPLIQGRGISAEEASSVLLLMLAVAILGRIFFGKLADIIGALPAYITASLWQTVLVFGFMQFNSLDSFYIFAVIYGFGYAGVMTGVLVTTSMLTAPSKRAWAIGVVSTFGWIGHGIGGYQGGFFYDLSGNYTQTFANAAMAGVINLVIVGALFWTISRRRQMLAV